jgi:hypothetical protein
MFANERDCWRIKNEQTLGSSPEQSMSVFLMMGLTTAIKSAADADEDNGIYVHVLICGALTEHGPIWLICGHPGGWSRRCQSQSLDQCGLSHTERKGWPLYGREKTGGQERVSSGATPHQILGGLMHE